MVFKGSLYILNLLCGIIPCEHKYPLPDTSPSNLRALQEQDDLDYEADVLKMTSNLTGDNGQDNLLRDLDYLNKTHPLVVDTMSGRMKGYWMRVVGGRKVRAFEGIPFAEPPINERRFKAPLPVRPWTGLLQANLKGPKCLQYNDITSARVVGSENCLFLNIYCHRMSFGKENSTRKHPVIVYLGGSFLTGSGNDFGPAYLLQREMILVTVNYRVGVLGFMSTNDEESPGNAGLKDQGEAINWVYNNIESFNGDKNKIILLGHGAGGACVQFHMMSFRTRGKFIAGISISGTAFNQWALHTKEQALNLTKKFAKSVQCPVHGTTKNMVACLRRQRGFDLVKMQIPFLDQWPLSLSLFRPVIEEEYQKEEPFLTESPEEAYQKGTVDLVPWICGQAEDEGYTFLLSHVALGTFGNLRKKWNTLAPDFFDYNNLPIDQDEITRRVNWLYFRHIDQSTAPIKIYSDAIGSRLIYTGIHKAIQAHSQHAETYAFMFGYNGKYNLATTAGIKSTEWAVGHGEILGYILNSTNMYAGFQRNDSELVLSKILVNLIYNFADKQMPSFTTGGGENFHLWNAVSDPQNISFLHITQKIKMIPEPYLQQVLYWESLGLPDSMPLANFSHEIQNVSRDPKAKGFVSTDITILGNTFPSGLLPPTDLQPGRFANDNRTFPSNSTEQYTSLSLNPESSLSLKEVTTGKYPDITTSAPVTTTTTTTTTTTAETTEKYPELTTSSPEAAIRTIETGIAIDTTFPTTSASFSSSTPTTTTTTVRPKFNRWIAQDFVEFLPIPDEPLKYNPTVSPTRASREQQKDTGIIPPTKATALSANLKMFQNLLNAGPYDGSVKNVPFGVSVPIFQNTLNTGFITKSNVGTRYYLNSLGGTNPVLNKRASFLKMKQ